MGSLVDRSEKIVRALLATLRFGSLICLLRRSMTLELSLCWDI